jgi:hypothetical protein
MNTLPEREKGRVGKRAMILKKETQKQGSDCRWDGTKNKSNSKMRYSVTSVALHAGRAISGMKVR